MRLRYVALLRAISNVGMQPFRQAIEELGFTAVESYGTSGNLLFSADRSDTRALERRITARLGAVAFVRSCPELARVAAHHPFRGRSGASVFFLARPPTARRQAFLRLGFEGPRPVLRGRTIFFVHTARLRGTRTPLDFERALGVQGTARSARVVEQLLGRMLGGASKSHGAAGSPAAESGTVRPLRCPTHARS
jgi:uncharacterized protein (DUF1697 family)